MKEHRLKTWPVFFAEVATGAKTFEIRKNDRDFRVGDVLILAEYDPDTGIYSGYELRVIVNYSVMLDSIPGMPKGFIGMSIELE
jgi:hypothetical protein